MAMARTVVHQTAALRRVAEFIRKTFPLPDASECFVQEDDSRRPGKRAGNPPQRQLRATDADGVEVFHPGTAQSGDTG